MHYGNLVIFNEEPEYAGHLKSALIRESLSKYKVYLFKTLESLNRFSEENKVDILVLGESTDTEIRKGLKASKKFVLTKEKNQKLNEDEEEIYKYQNVQAIVFGISKAAGHKGTCADNGNKKLIGVYSPVHRTGSTKFALELGNKLSKDEAVLYLNLEAYAGRGCYFNGDADKDISDLIYYIHQENCNLSNILGKLTFSKGSLDIVNPAEQSQDIKEVKANEWLILFERIFEETAYTTIILDLCDMVDGLNMILSKCNTVYTRYVSDDISKAKIEQYTDNLRATGYTKVIEHTVLEEVDNKEGAF